MEVGQDDLEKFLEAARELEIKGLTEDINRREENEQHIVLDMNELSENDIIEENATLVESDDVISITSIKSEMVPTSRPEKVTYRAKSGKSNDNQCKECLSKFASGGALINHRRSKHEGVSYSCDFCEYKNGQAGNLKKHVTNHHSNKV